MKKCLKILFILVIAAIIGLFCLHRYLECNPLHLGGGPSDPPPARCYAKEQEQHKENTNGTIRTVGSIGIYV